MSIFIVSYLRDLEWLRHCLASVRKFDCGFSGVTVLVPQHELGQFKGIVVPPYALTGYEAPSDPLQGYVRQMVAKMHADEYCPEADLIFHMDSDCIFTKPVCPEDYLREGKPELPVATWDKVGGAIHWRVPNEITLGHPCPYETMRRHPEIYWRRMYVEFRQHIQRVHGKSIDDYMAPFTMHDPRLPTDFNLLGGYAIARPEWFYRYAVIDVGKHGYPVSTKKMRQFWSWSPPDRLQTYPDGITKGVPIVEINRILYNK